MITTEMKAMSIITKIIQDKEFEQVWGKEKVRVMDKAVVKFITKHQPQIRHGGVRELNFD